MQCAINQSALVEQVHVELPVGAPSQHLPRVLHGLVGQRAHGLHHGVELPLGEDRGEVLSQHLPLVQHAHVDGGVPGLQLLDGWIKTELTFTLYICSGDGLWKLHMVWFLGITCH